MLKVDTSFLNGLRNLFYNRVVSYVYFVIGLLHVMSMKELRRKRTTCQKFVKGDLQQYHPIICLWTQIHRLPVKFVWAFRHPSIPMSLDFLGHLKLTFLMVRPQRVRPLVFVRTKTPIVSFVSTL